MKIEIIYLDRNTKRTVKFDGDNAMEEGFRFIGFNVPLTILAIRVTLKEQHP